MNVQCPQFYDDGNSVEGKTKDCPNRANGDICASSKKRNTDEKQRKTTRLTVPGGMKKVRFERLGKAEINKGQFVLNCPLEFGCGRRI